MRSTCITSAIDQSIAIDVLGTINVKQYCPCFRDIPSYILLKNIAGKLEFAWGNSYDLPIKKNKKIKTPPLSSSGAVQNA